MCYVLLWWRANDLAYEHFSKQNNIDLRKKLKNGPWTLTNFNETLNAP